MPLSKWIIGYNMSTLCPPAAAISNARLTDSCPFISASGGPTMKMMLSLSPN
jgi:hypothetical protein